MICSKRVSIKTGLVDFLTSHLTQKPMNLKALGMARDLIACGAAARTRALGRERIPVKWLTKPIMYKMNWKELVCFKKSKKCTTLHSPQTWKSSTYQRSQVSQISKFNKSNNTCSVFFLFYKRWWQFIPPKNSDDRSWGQEVLDTGLIAVKKR